LRPPPALRAPGSGWCTCATVSLAPVSFASWRHAEPDGPPAVGRSGTLPTPDPQSRGRSDLEAPSGYAYGGPRDPGREGKAMRHRRVEDVMTREVVTVSERTPYKAVVRLLTEHEITVVPVVADDRRVLGIVTEGDLLLRQEHRGADDPPPAVLPRRERIERAKAAGVAAGELMTS